MKDLDFLAIVVCAFLALIAIITVCETVTKVYGVSP